VRRTRRPRSPLTDELDLAGRLIADYSAEDGALADYRGGFEPVTVAAPAIYDDLVAPLADQRVTHQ
jgi:hypothetical protein